MKTLKSYLVLCRIYVSLFAAGSAATGFLVAPSPFVRNITFPVIGVFLLACGASALNQYQERSIDALMERTRHRPLPAGTLAPQHALIASLVLILSGLALLAFGGIIVSGLGLAAVLWYNGVYTPLKRKTAFAAVYGALVGAIPPAIGWASGSGSLFHPKLFALSMLFFLWQVPHFWLLLLRSRADYDRAGLPSLTRLIPRARLARITVLWIGASAVASLALPLFSITRSPIIYFCLLPAAAWLTGSAVRMLLRDETPEAYLSEFRRVNSFILVVMLLVSLDPFLGSVP